MQARCLRGPEIWFGTMQACPGMQLRTRERVHPDITRPKLAMNSTLAFIVTPDFNGTNSFPASRAGLAGNTRFPTMETEHQCKLFKHGRNRNFVKTISPHGPVPRLSCWPSCLNGSQFVNIDTTSAPPCCPPKG